MERKNKMPGKELTLDEAILKSYYTVTELGAKMEIPTKDANFSYVVTAYPVGSNLIRIDIKVV